MKVIVACTSIGLKFWIGFYETPDVLVALFAAIGSVYAQELTPESASNDHGETTSLALDTVVVTA